MKQIKSVTTGLLVTLCFVLMSFSTNETTRPQTGINQSFADKISLKELKKLDEFSIDVKGEDVSVISCRLVVAPKRGEAYMKSFKGNTITGYTLSKIQNASVNDRILIDKVVAQYGNGLKTFCQPVMVEIIE